jgi:hypothetical protein
MPDESQSTNCIETGRSGTPPETNEKAKNLLKMWPSGQRKTQEPVIPHGDLRVIPNRAQSDQAQDNERIEIANFIVMP